MDGVFSELINEIEGKRDEIDIAVGVFKGGEITVRGEAPPEIHKNADMEPGEGDRILCIIADGAVYALCRLG